MKILLTGIAGFIGSHVAEAYERRGWEIVGLDDFSTGRPENVPAGMRVHTVDVRHPRLLDRVISQERPDVVNHHAAHVDVGRINRRPGEALVANVSATLNVLESCVRHGVGRVIFVSSAAVYGDPQGLPISETQPFQPISIYGMTKAAGEMLVRVYERNHGLRHVILRYSNAYGPRQLATAEGGVVASFLDSLERGEAPRIAWDGEQRRDFIFVEDLAEANVAAVDRGEGEAFNIGTGHPTSINTLLKTACDATGIQREPLRVPRREGDIRDSYFECGWASEQLNWRARTPLAEGLRALVSWRRGRKW